MNDIESFRQYMRGKGVEPPSVIIADGKGHRFHVNGDKPGSKNASYVFNSIVGVGYFRCFKRNISGKWTKRSSKTQAMTKREKEAYDAKIEEMERQHDEERKQRYAECRKKARGIWERATEKRIKKHPYALRKGIKPYAAKTNDLGNLIIPVYNINQKLQGLQFISEDGTKKFLTGTAKNKKFSVLGKNLKKSEAIILCEGWATGCSIHEATGLPVVVAFDTGNLKPVAEVWRRKLPEQKIIIAGDDDHATEGNPGWTKAMEAAKAVKGIAVFPVFKDATGKTDFNDMHQEQGLDSVKDIIMEACTKDPNEFDHVEWQEPIPFGDIETPEIPFTLLPEVLAEYCKAVTSHTQTPPGLSIMIGLAVVATCLQKLFEVSPYGDSYREPVNIMAVVALDSASRKTAVKNAMTEPLTDWEKKQREALEEEAARVRHEREMLMKSIDSIKSAASKVDVTEEERRDALEKIKQLEESMPNEIIMPHLWTDDVTIERLQNLMMENGERIAIISDEGGFFEVIAGLYTGGKININVVLQSHAGSPVRVQRQGRSVHGNGNDSFRRSELHSAVHGRFQRVDRLIAALKVLTERHIISEPQEQYSGRRPVIFYKVSPFILKMANRDPQRPGGGIHTVDRQIRAAVLVEIDGEGIILQQVRSPVYLPQIARIYGKFMGNAGDRTLPGFSFDD